MTAKLQKELFLLFEINKRRPVKRPEIFSLKHKSSKSLEKHTVLAVTLSNHTSVALVHDTYTGLQAQAVNGINPHFFFNIHRVLL